MNKALLVLFFPQIFHRTIIFRVGPFIREQDFLINQLKNHADRSHCQTCPLSQKIHANEVGQGIIILYAVRNLHLNEFSFLILANKCLLLNRKMIKELCLFMYLQGYNYCILQHNVFNLILIILLDFELKWPYHFFNILNHHLFITHNHAIHNVTNLIVAMGSLLLK